MPETIKTTFRNGVFVPQSPVDFPESEEVEIVVNKIGKGSSLNEPERNLTDQEKERLLSEFVRNMQSNPIPINAPRRLTREELHERS